MNIQKAIEIYLQWKDSHTQYAKSRYEVRLRHFQDYLTPDIALRSLSGNDVAGYHQYMQEHYGLGTVAYSARILRNFFEFWHGRGGVALNPKEIIPIRYTTVDKAVATKSDLEEMASILEEGNIIDLKKKLILHLLWDTGMRISELSELKLGHISAVHNGVRTAKVRSRKSMRYNLVAWGKEANRLLDLYLAYRLDLELEHDYLLVNQRKENLSVRSIQRWIKELCELVMLDKDLTPHSFRHAKAHYILDHGGNVRDVQAVLRHVKPESSFHYLQLNPSQYLQVAQKYLVA